jgi:hypothetical protein
MIKEVAPGALVAREVNRNSRAVHAATRRPQPRANRMAAPGPPAEPGFMTNSQGPSASDPPPRDPRPISFSRPAGARDPRAGTLSRVKIGSPAAVLAVVPHLLGFHPASSLVMLGISGRRSQIRLTFRYDLPDPPDPALAAEIAGHAADVLARQQISAAIVVGYGPGPLVTPLADLLRRLLPAAGVSVREMLRVESGRYWSYVCHDPACCPADGVPFDAASHPVAVALSRAGLAAYPDRAALAGTLAARPDAVAAMRAATQRAQRRAEALLSAAPDQPRRAGQAFAEAGRSAVAEAIACYRDGGEITDDDQLAWLAVALADLRVRDDAWARMDPRFRAPHQRLWLDLVRRAAADYVPAPACLLAVTAWQSGEGALASVAVERALGADPDYSMALLLGDVLAAGLPPEAARPPMTPEEVAASYSAARRRGRSGRPARTRGRMAGGR